ncbi:MAG: DUF2309 domain-containing protein [Polyangiaceae bacterium]
MPASESPDPTDAAPSVSPDAIANDLLARACERVAPSWPLDRFIAVNPLWKMVDEPLEVVARRMASHAGSDWLMPRSWYREARTSGRIRDEHLAAALRRKGTSLSVEEVTKRLARRPEPVQVRARMTDVVDAVGPAAAPTTWKSFVTQSVSQFCAAYFDDGQAEWGPPTSEGLYAAWREHAAVDRAPRLLMRSHGIDALAASLPRRRESLVARALADLDVPVGQTEAYLWDLLLDQNGWASHCAYRRWIAGLEGRSDDTLEELAAIRLAWEWMLFRSGSEDVRRAWKDAVAAWPRIDAIGGHESVDRWVAQEALEVAWREPVLHALERGTSSPTATRPEVQAIFCIDVRSEVFRRALEAVSPAVRTLGFAGFFGIPLEYRPLVSGPARPHLPGPLAPRWSATPDPRSTNGDLSERGALVVRERIRSFGRGVSSSFAFVEAMGLTYVGHLLADAFALGTDARRGETGSSPRLADGGPPVLATRSGDVPTLVERVELAEGILRGASLVRNFAPLVALVGHGSTTRNNPLAAGLACGACCGQSGEVSARVAASLLNDRDVREGLARRGIPVPEDTTFVAGVHDTTTDEVTLFDRPPGPREVARRIEALEDELRAAAVVGRRERSRALGVADRDDAALLEVLRERARDWSEVRPEWGLAGNAAFVAAPRERTRHVDFAGRAFLHEYVAEDDPDGKVLEAILTAPVVVAHWINFQYYASTVDPVRYGSGNKVLHNVVGGHLGVFEGNAGDLRIGLPMQSLHDGTTFVHEPLRLTVFVDAPASAIDAVLAKHPHVRALAEGGWMTLVRLGRAAGESAILQDGRWRVTESLARTPPEGGT